MNLSSVDTPTLLGWKQQALESVAAWMSGAKPASLNYSQADGSRGASYQTTTLTEARAWLIMLDAELMCRNAIPMRRSRRAIGIRF